MKIAINLSAFLSLLLLILTGCNDSATNPPAVSIGYSVATNQAALAEFSSRGITLVELSGIHEVMHNDVDFAIMKSSLQTAGFSVNSIHYPYGPSFDISNLDEATRAGAIEELQFYLRRLAELDGQYLIVHPSFEPVPALDRDARLKACRNSILELNELMEQFPGMMLAIEDLPRTCLGNTADELNALIADTAPDRIGICLDTNHMLQEDLITFTEKTAERIVTVHIADFDGIDERHWFPGQGINDWHKWAEVMKATNYKGPMLYEVTWPIARGRKLTPRQHAALISLNYQDYFAR